MVEPGAAACDLEYMRTAKVGDLEIQIEELVRAHIAAVREAASAAVERAFEGAAVRRAKSERAAARAKDQAVGVLRQRSLRLGSACTRRSVRTRAQR